jgi:hypothetical protein
MVPQARFLFLGDLRILRPLFLLLVIVVFSSCNNWSQHFRDTNSTLEVQTTTQNRAAENASSSSSKRAESEAGSTNAIQALFNQGERDARAGSRVLFLRGTPQHAEPIDPSE